MNDNYMWVPTFKLPRPSKNYGDLPKLLKSHGCDADTCCGIIFCLNNDENYSKMTTWLNKHKTAKQTEIMHYCDSISNLGAYYSVAN